MDVDDAPPQRRHTKLARPQWTNRKNALSDVSTKDTAAQFEDSLGRTYVVIGSGKLFDDYVERGDITPSEWFNPDVFLTNDTIRAHTTGLGPQLLQMRLQAKIDKRVVPEPEIDGGIIEIRHIRTARKCRITYTNVIWPKRGRNLILFCSSFVAYAETTV